MASVRGTFAYACCANELELLMLRSGRFDSLFDQVVHSDKGLPARARADVSKGPVKRLLYPVNTCQIAPYASEGTPLLLLVNPLLSLDFERCKASSVCLLRLAVLRLRFAAFYTCGTRHASVLTVNRKC